MITIMILHTYIILIQYTLLYTKITLISIKFLSGLEMAKKPYLSEHHLICLDKHQLGSIEGVIGTYNQ